MSLFYRPYPAAVGDVIPFAAADGFHLFYLRDGRVPGEPAASTPWYHLRTSDFVAFDDLGEAIPRGGPDAQDLDIYTGCAIEHDGRFHIFYTGHNNSYVAQGRPSQVVMHATSDDLIDWEKDASFQLAPTAGYEPQDWRDPFVFWNPDAGEFWMLLAARLDTGPPRLRGCTALLASPDLRSWAIRDPFWAPQQFFTHECPDLFKLGDWWYLVFSEFSERTVTRYRMSRSLDGPWLAPADDVFDGRAFYAAKTAERSGRRYAFGWLPTRAEDSDSGGWQWGGSLVVHELGQRPDGTLRVRLPDSVAAAFGPGTAAPTSAPGWEPVAAAGAWSFGTGSARADATGGYAAAVLAGLPDVCLVTAAVTLGPTTTAAGLLVRCADNLDTCYEVRLEPAAGRLVIDRRPRPGDQPFVLERPMVIPTGTPIRLQVVLDGTCLVVYADDEVALSCRSYAHRTGGVGCFVADGTAEFADVSVRPAI